MNYQAFNLDQNSAKQADAGGRIEHTGKYVGTIKSMEFITAKSGTQGFEINFENDAKEAAIISIYTAKKDGTQLSGHHKINALLVCAGVRGLTPKSDLLEKYDFDTKQRVKKSCVIAPEMTGIKVGLLLQRENYTNDNGQQRHRMQFFACFNAQSELMAKEVLERKTTPELLPKALDRLLAMGDSTQANTNNSQGYSPSQGQPQSKQGYGQQQSQGYGNQPQPHDDDNLPF